MTKQEDQLLVRTLRDRHNALTLSREEINGEIDAIEVLLARYNTRQEAVPKKHREKVIPKRPGAGTTKHDQVVEIALQLIRKTQGPVRTRDIIEASEKKVDLSSAAIYVILSNEVSKQSGKRLIRVGPGMYNEKSKGIAMQAREGHNPVKPVILNRTQEEWDQLAKDAKKKEELQQA